MEQREELAGSGNIAGDQQSGGNGACGANAETRVELAPVPKWTAKDTARFWAKVDRSGGDDACWFWVHMGANEQKYGTFWVAGKLHHAHRIAWSLANGEWAATKFVCHHCDQKACCNPAHLFAGTHADNMRDMVAKGRHARAGGKKPGAFDVRNKLTADLALQVFRAQGLHRDIAKTFGVVRQTVSDVKIGRRWGHVTAAERHLRCEIAAALEAEAAKEGAK